MNKLIYTFLLAIVMTACSSGGDGDDGGGNVQRSWDADGEAPRMGALYLGLRDAIAVIYPYTRNSASLAALDDTSAPCAGGGSAAYSYFPGNNGAQLSFDATFNNCQDALGLINGNIKLRWNATQENVGNGVFGAQFDGIITIDGVAYNFDQSGTIVTSYNANSGLQNTVITVQHTSSGVQGPNGPALSIRSLTTRVQRQGSANTVTISDMVTDFVGFGGPTMQIGANAPCTVAVLPSSSVILGVGLPQACTFSYARQQRSSQGESIFGTAVTNAGLVNLTLEGQRTHLDDAGQYTWQNMTATAIYQPDGE